MGDFNAVGAFNALAGISKLADKPASSSPPGKPATTQQHATPGSVPKPVAPAPRGVLQPVARPGVHPEDRSARHASGEHAKPTKAPLQSRTSAPNDPRYATSGIEQAMGALADKLHKPVHKYGRAQARRK